jgi:hypothetical protein
VVYAAFILQHSLTLHKFLDSHLVIVLVDKDLEVAVWYLPNEADEIMKSFRQCLGRN